MAGERACLNAYLRLEFGLEDEGGDAHVSEAWPFELHPVGEIATSGGRASVYVFEDGGEPFFAVGGRQLAYYACDGFDVMDLEAQYAGAAWIDERDPISLADSCPGHPTIPSMRERRQHLDGLLTRLAHGNSYELVEGLYLAGAGAYLGLAVREAGDGIAFGGPLPEPVTVAGSTAAPWRRLAVAVGRALVLEREDG